MAWKYKRILPKVLIAKLDLIEPEDLVGLVGRSLDHIYTRLVQTAYREELLAIPSQKRDATSIEDALHRNLIRTCEEIADSSPKDIRFLISTILKKFETNNVKAILRAIWARINVEEAMKYIIPCGEMDEKRCRTILESSKSISDAIALLSDLEYGSILKETRGYLDGIENMLILESALDRLVYERIGKAIDKLRGRDKRIARTILQFEIDALNIKIILRCLSLGVSKERIMGYLVTSTAFNQVELANALETMELNAFFESLLSIVRHRDMRHYESLLYDLIEEHRASESSPHMEVILDTYILKMSLEMVDKYTPYFNISPILAFLNAKWFEVRNLGSILIGTQNNMSPDKIKQLLILPNY